MNNLGKNTSWYPVLIIFDVSNISFCPSFCKIGTPVLRYLKDNSNIIRMFLMKFELYVFGRCYIKWTGN